VSNEPDYTANEDNQPQVSVSDTAPLSPYSSPTPAVPPLTVEPTPAPICEADLWIEGLTLREKIGQLIMPRLPWQTTQLTPALHEWFADYPVGGIILFTDNVYSIQQVQMLTADMQAASRNMLFIATDEEGGRVSRIGRLFDNTTFPILPAYDIGRSGDPGMAYMTGRNIGQQLLTLGINMNFAPVADIWTNPANTVIGNRSFGSDPDVVGDMVYAAVQGLNNAGVLSTIKHFPGHGDTYEDSHYLLAVYPHDWERFDTVESLPFVRGIDAGVHAVMMGHIATPQLQNHEALFYWMEPWLESGTLPATFSDFWVQDILRGVMGFDGLVITDALEMRALSDNFTPAQVALGAFMAGADILLMPTNVTVTFDALINAYHDGVFDQQRLHESLRRIFWARQELMS